MSSTAPSNAFLAQDAEVAAGAAVAQIRATLAVGMPTFVRDVRPTNAVRKAREAGRSRSSPSAVSPREAKPNDANGLLWATFAGGATDTTTVPFLLTKLDALLSRLDASNDCLLRVNGSPLTPVLDREEFIYVLEAHDLDEKLASCLDKAVSRCLNSIRTAAQERWTFKHDSYFNRTDGVAFDTVQGDGALVVEGRNWLGCFFVFKAATAEELREIAQRLTIPINFVVVNSDVMVRDNGMLRFPNTWEKLVTQISAILASKKRRFELNGVSSRYASVTVAGASGFFTVFGSTLPGEGKNSDRQLLHVTPVHEYVDSAPLDRPDHPSPRRVSVALALAVLPANPLGLPDEPPGASTHGAGARDGAGEEGKGSRGGRGGQGEEGGGGSEFDDGGEAGESSALHLGGSDQEPRNEDGAGISTSGTFDSAEWGAEEHGSDRQCALTATHELSWQVKTGEHQSSVMKLRFTPAVRYFLPVDELQKLLTITAQPIPPSVTDSGFFVPLDSSDLSTEAPSLHGLTVLSSSTSSKSSASSTSSMWLDSSTAGRLFDTFRHLELSDLVAHHESVVVLSSPSLPFVLKLVEADGEVQHQEMLVERNMYETLARLPDGGGDITVQYLGSITSPDGYEGMVLEKGQPFSFAECLPLDDVRNLVRRFHALGYVHGDLRVPNFVRTTRGLRLIDFGRAEKASQDARQLELEEFLDELSA
ncbi:uncharacterized protein JCM10292_006768 [Rhodotorula paludigena]|uniref:uncharacterized protein n=1 Tax=Rhodotorula paludigena TaxID=86838 RepID=UPI0031784504